jgi:hypothetical protein
VVGLSVTGLALALDVGRPIYLTIGFWIVTLGVKLGLLRRPVGDSMS